MDNDKQVKDLSVIHDSVRLFLGDELRPLEAEAGNAYDLEEEYAKTRKTRNLRVWLLLALCFVFVGIVSLGITLAVSHSDKKIEININTFDDLNLRNLLSSVGRTQSMFESATRKKASLMAVLESELKLAERKKENDLFTMQSVASVSSKAALRRRAEAVEKEFEATVERLHKEYDVQIQAAENEIQQYSKQLDDYDGSKLASARNQEAVIDSQKQLHDIEMKNLTERYEAQILELREQMAAQQKAAAEAQRKAVEDVRETYQAKIDLLDPIVNDFHGKQVVQNSQSSVQDSGYNFNAGDYKDGSVEKNSDYEKLLDSTQRAFDDFDYISSIVSAIPQERDIPSYVRAMKAKTYQIGNTLAKRNMDLQEQNDFYESVMDYYIQKNACDGIVMGITSGKEVRLYFSKAAEEKLRDNSVKAQIRDGKRVVSEVGIEKSGLYYKAVSEAENLADEVLPFYLVYIIQPK